MSILAQIAATLEASGIRHAMIGGMALTAYKINRATLDVDLLVVDAACLSPERWSDLASQGVAVEVRKGDLTDPLAGVVRFNGHGESIDLVVGKFGWQRRIIERAEPIPAVEVPVARAADLILLKLYAGGFQDAWDIHQLLAHPSREERINEVELHLAELPDRCSELWRKIIQEQSR